MAASVYSRAIQKAADLLGGRERLAEVLLVPASDIDSWITDRARPPRELFLRVVDIVLDEGGASAGASEPDEPAPPRECGESSGTESELL